MPRKPMLGRSDRGGQSVCKTVATSSTLVPASKKKRMQFIEDIHKYTEDGIDYLSVTTFLKKFQEWVDWDEICRKKAKKLGVAYEDLRKEWNDARDKGANRGTAFHKYMEDKYSTEVVVDTTLYPVVSLPTLSGVKEESSMKLQNNIVYTEKMIWNKRYAVCGTADVVEVIDGKINIKDYKTNKKLDTEAWKHPVTGPKKLKFPVQGLDDCNFNLYSLQVNLYMYMLLQANRNLKIGKMTLLHIHFNEDGNSTMMIPYEVKNLQREVQGMLETYLKTKK